MFDVILKKENVEDMKSYIFLRGGMRVGFQRNRKRVDEVTHNLHPDIGLNTDHQKSSILFSRSLRRSISFHSNNPMKQSEKMKTVQIVSVRLRENLFGNINTTY